MSPYLSHTLHGITIQIMLLCGLCAGDVQLDWVRILQEPGEDKWRYLLGNTLLRMLGYLPLSTELTLYWQAAALAASAKPGPDTGDRGQAELTRQAHVTSTLGITEGGEAALEMLMVMLPEFCTRQPMVLTVSLLHQWRSGDVGLVRRGLAEIEFRHARLNRLDLDQLSACKLATGKNAHL